MKKKLLFLAIIPLLVVACNNETNGEQSSNPIISSEQKIESSNELTSSKEDISSEISSSEEISSAESSSSSKEEESVKEDTYRLSFDAILLKDEDKNAINLTYDIPDEYLSFNHSSTTFKKELAVASLPFVVHATELDKIKEVYSYYQFDDLSISADYSLEETENTVKYVIGHKKINDVDLINLTIAGYNYLKPWKSNFAVGSSGTHQGFQEGAIKVLPSIVNYLNKYNESTRTILYINGYSRSAAISNVLITMLIDNNVIKEENLYAYLFETPCGIDINNKKEYNSIFNIINSADLISYVAPIEYGLKRVGVDIEIYQENADEIILNFDNRLNIGKFTPVEGDTGFANDVEFVKYFISYLLEPVDEAQIEVPTKDLSTRENYCNNLEPDISYLATFFLSLPNEVIDKVSETISSKGIAELLSLLEVDGLYNFIQPILDEFNISYDADLLKEKLNNALYLLQQKSNILFLMMSAEQRNNLLRTVYFHTLETVLPLLINL